MLVLLVLSASAAPHTLPGLPPLDKAAFKQCVKHGAVASSREQRQRCKFPVVTEGGDGVLFPLGTRVLVPGPLKREAVFWADAHSSCTELRPAGTQTVLTADTQWSSDDGGWMEYGTSMGFIWIEAPKDRDAWTDALGRQAIFVGEIQYDESDPCVPVSLVNTTKIYAGERDALEYLGPHLPF